MTHMHCAALRCGVRLEHGHEGGGRLGGRLMPVNHLVLAFTATPRRARQPGLAHVLVAAGRQGTTHQPQGHPILWDCGFRALGFRV